MLHKAKFVLCSEIHAQYTNSMWSQCRIFECQILWYVKLPVDFKMLKDSNCEAMIEIGHIVTENRLIITCQVPQKIS